MGVGGLGGVRDGVLWEVTLKEGRKEGKGQRG